ncbi:hypothetical protein L1787_18235 [Acuticoccus sp. M5D2P5]|uniref:hypothetical protein n=1 Tax=Acuticoccus kalidii TaxID=2910977 RepID=UPI001F37F2E1|nr:hypothetical protein [Acuticoccus kalidii]MCF3935337.1 hypothetical protein [Acuticoccus kalidii]
MEPDYLGAFNEAHPNWMASMKQVSRAEPSEGYPGNNGVEIWRTQRDIIGAVMRGDETPEDGLAEMVEVTDGLIAR